MIRRTVGLVVTFLLLFSGTGWADERHGRSIREFVSVRTHAVAQGSAEIIASTLDGRRVLVGGGESGTLSVVNISNLKRIENEATIAFKEYDARANVTSVAVMPDGEHALVAVRFGDDRENPTPGKVAVVAIRSGQVVAWHTVGIGPDSLAVTPDGRYAVVANEDEEADPTTGDVDMARVNRPGTITILRFNDSDPSHAESYQVDLQLAGVHGAAYANDPQPEYVAISPDGRRAAVTLQENNAVAVVNIADRQVERIFGLGVVTHAADLSKDGRVHIADTLIARPEPDGVAWTPDGRHLITANEGDLGKNEFGDGVWSGGRNIMVWDLEGRAVYDSGSLIEEAAAAAGLYPDNRSANRGTEPEAVLVTEFGAQAIAAVALERAGAIVFVDVTDPLHPVMLNLLRTGESPEAVVRINGKPLIVASDEKNGVLHFFAPVHGR